MDLVSKIGHTLKGQGLPLQSVLADSGFSSGGNYAGLEQKGILGYVSISGVYKPERGMFTYQPTQDAYVCSQGKVLPRVGLRIEQGSPKYYYYSKTSDCGQCPLKAACCASADTSNSPLLPSAATTSICRLGWKVLKGNG